MSLDVHQAFTRKSFFVTGGSGFMGKVLLFKLLKEFPDIGNIYVLIRGKTSRKLKRYLSSQERLEVEVLGSTCFDPLRADMGEEKFKSLCSRVVGVEGNITADRLGLSDQNRRMIMQSVNFIVHMAATVDFDERLNVAVETNTLGALRVLALARECKKLEAMVHVSTCYVNYNLQGSIVEECLYPLPFDPEAMCKHILALHDDEIETVGQKLLKKYGFPNTYTLTKSMGEQLLSRCKGNCPVVIVRPSIVGCSYKEPFPGWVDALTAAGALLLTGGLGLVKELSGRPEAIADIVPVDFVINTIIKALFKTQHWMKSQRAESAAATQPLQNHHHHHQQQQQQQQHAGRAFFNVLAASGSLKKNGTGGVEEVSPLTTAAVQQQQQQQQQQHEHDSTPTAVTVTNLAPTESSEVGLPFIYHAATSSSVNNLTWERLRDASKVYWDWKKRHPKAFGPMGIDIIESTTHYLLRFYLYRELPYHVLRLLANLPPPIGSEERQRFAMKMGKAIFRAKDLNRQFCAFTLREWIFSTANTNSLDDGLCKRSRSALYFDTYMINWWFYSHAYSHGLLKYVVKDTGSYKTPEQPEIPTDVFKRASSI